MIERLSPQAEMIRELHEAEAEHRAAIRLLPEEISDEQLAERVERINRKYRSIFNAITSRYLHPSL
jgi:uncharacterized alpha-E superfamily protein